ncbi:membrane protein [Microbacterium phage Rudy]|nr:membrane protein [Microbacterium phage Rudy]
MNAVETVAVSVLCADTVGLIMLWAVTVIAGVLAISTLIRWERGTPKNLAIEIPGAIAIGVAGPLLVAAVLLSAPSPLT